MDGSGGINFMAKFCMLECQFSFGGEWRGGHRGERLWISRRGHFFDVLFYVANELGHLQLVKGGE